MQIGIVTLFPEMFSAITEHGITSRAVKEGLVNIQHWNPRDFTSDRHRTVDDKPYGGGPGMLMMAAPLTDAIKNARQKLTQAKVIYLSPQGKPLSQETVESLAQSPELILLCGRYEGVDERVIDTCVDEQYSLGDFVLSGGEIAAMALMDAMIRLQPGALGHEMSASTESFSEGLLEYPQYTRPEHFAGKDVPQVLLSGDHQKIARWRLKQSLGRTWLNRPDLLETANLTNEQQELLSEFIQEN